MEIERAVPVPFLPGIMHFRHLPGLDVRRRTDGPGAADCEHRIAEQFDAAVQQEIPPTVEHHPVHMLEIFIDSLTPTMFGQSRDSRAIVPTVILRAVRPGML